jgi:hypothetical protein
VTPNGKNLILQRPLNAIFVRVFQYSEVLDGESCQYVRGHGRQGTPSCRDGDELAVRQTEWPFFKPRSPERSDLREPGAGGRRFELSGFVLTNVNSPAAQALSVIASMASD